MGFAEEKLESGEPTLRNWDDMKTWYWEVNAKKEYINAALTKVEDKYGPYELRKVRNAMVRMDRFREVDEVQNATMKKWVNQKIQHIGTQRKGWMDERMGFWIPNQKIGFSQEPPEISQWYLGAF